MNWIRGTLLLALAAGWPAAARAEDPTAWNSNPVLPHDLILGQLLAPSSPSPGSRPYLIRLFRIQPAFPSDPVGLDQDDPDDRVVPRKDDGPNWLQLSMGTDNPYFDVRLPGDPGGVGYYKVHSQVQLFDNQRTGCAVGLQAWTPAGMEMDGVPDGPTVVSPALSLFHTLDDGTAIQGFVGKHVPLNPRQVGQFGRSVQCGMAVQRPLVQGTPNSPGSLYLFVETLGRYRYEPDTNPLRPDLGNRAAAQWDVLPGLHWRLNDNVWISGGLILPVNSAPIDARLWQLTCSFRF
jgi:hypothetical protein